MLRYIWLVLIMLAVAIPAEVFAAKEARPMKIDRRVRTVLYQPDEVYKFTGHYRFQSTIEFAPGEDIITISMGDATGWQLNPSGNRLFLKPIDQDATTNMSVITTNRNYLFELHAAEATGIDDPTMTFLLRFVYPGEEQSLTVKSYLDAVPSIDIERNPEKYNFNYTISGPERIAPIRIFDDGQFTYFEFRDKNADVPAFFLVDKLGEESIINYRTRGNYIVVERVGARFTLRYGSDIVCVFNEKISPRVVKQE